MSESLLAPAFLFRFRVPCRRTSALWAKGRAALSESHRLPALGQLEGKPEFAEIRAGWNEDGIAFSVQVGGKQQALWCRSSRLEESDGFQVWIDTRDTHTIHRASRFCHQFIASPVGGGTRQEEPILASVPINRAKEQPKPAPPSALHIYSEVKPHGYSLEFAIEAAALTGFDPGEHPRLGFMCAAMDRELGWQTFSIDSQFPFQEDPSLWATLELVE